MNRTLFEQSAQKFFRGNDLVKLNQALDLCEDLYKSEIRLSSVSYFDHVTNIASRLVNLNIGVHPVIAAFLFYAVEHQLISLSEVEKLFGSEVKTLVVGVADFKDITETMSVAEQDSFNLRKLLLASTADIRVLIIRLADRVENILSVEFLPEEKKCKSISKTENLYIPLCEYSGIATWKRIMEDEVFRLREGETYYAIKSRIEEYLRVESVILSSLQVDLEGIASKFFSGSEVHGRMKGIYSIYKKIAKLEKEGYYKDAFNRIQDKFAFRVVVDSIENCYKVFEEIVSRWDVAESYYKLKDYIEFPKPNGYRSIHFIISVEGLDVEIQIRTFEMHEYNEFGPASHIAYKLSGKRNAKASSEYSWTKDLVQWSQEDGVDRFELKVFQDNIYVLSPKGNLIELPKSSTPVDFAYKIHTDIGNRCERAFVNGVNVPLSKPLRNGDKVEIQINKFKRFPSEEWLDFIVSDLAKEKVRLGLKSKRQDDIKQK